MSIVSTAPGDARLSSVGAARIEHRARYAAPMELAAPLVARSYRHLAPNGALRIVPSAVQEKRGAALQALRDMADRPRNSRSVWSARHFRAFECQAYSRTQNGRLCQWLCLRRRVSTITH
jgi:hypothetical protein